MFGRVRRVTVWREEVLPSSETFIVNQIGALRRWTPVLSGLRAVPSALGVRPDFALEGRAGAVHRVDRRLYWRLGTSPRLHRHLTATALVHAHFGPDAARLTRAARIARRPLIATFHGYDITVPAPRLGVDYRALFTRAERLVAVSDFVRSCLIAAGAPERRVRVLPIGIPLPDDPGEAGTADGRVLFVGRLVAKKGCADLLAALGGMTAPPEVDIIGDGPLRAELQDLAVRLRIRARFLGPREPAAVDAAMRAGALLCVPSRTAADGDREGFGMVFLEAAAHRLPVVSYASGGVPEAVADGETGLLVPEGDTAALARAIQTVLGDRRLARALGAAGRARVESRFEIAACTAALESLYDEVADRTAG